MQRDPGTTQSAAWRSEFLDRHRLKPAYLKTAAACFDPLAARLADAAAGDGPLLVGLNGSQGSGKSTLCDYLVTALGADHDVNAVALSLDDFYLTLAERRSLAQEIHPLLATRGVPGTHDMDLLEQTIADLFSAGESGDYAVPSFDKSIDDRAPPQSWPRVRRPLQLVLLEGWCMGACSEPDEALRAPVNDFEAAEDPEAVWRAYSNAALQSRYEPFYQRVDYWVMFAAPSFEQVLTWRTEQEEKLAAKVGGRGSGLMDAAGLRRFVSHFERYTRQCLQELPAKMDVVMRLDAQRTIVDVRGIEASE